MGGGIVFLLQMVIYHISFPVLFLLSRILNQSFLLYYLNQTLPQLIAPLNNCDLRTFTISPLEVQRIHQIRPHLLPPIVCSWMPPPEVETFITRQVSLDSIAVLSVEWRFGFMPVRTSTGYRFLVIQCWWRFLAT